jgi:hypothetical protein
MFCLDVSGGPDAAWMRMVTDAPTVPRMALKAYVCGPTCVQWVMEEGTSRLIDVLTRRPNNCRYAIVETAEGYMSIDMYDLMTSNSLKTYHLGAHETFTDLDAAVVATAMNYQS